MRLTTKTMVLPALLLTVTWLGGCQPQETADTKPYEAGEPEAHDHDHDHPSEGPNHGQLIELGNEEYHGELVHDEEAGSVTIYILDGAAAKTVPIDATELVINVTHDGQGEQFKLAAKPVEGDPEGKSSRFVTEDEHLGEDLHADGVQARMTVMIGEKSYNGKIPVHDHDHDHDHDHGDHAHDDHDHDEADHDHAAE